MARDLGASLVTAIQEGTVRPVLLVEAEFASGTLRLWSGVGDLSWSGNTYTGAGNLLGVSPIEETNDVRAAGIQISLNAMSAEVLALAIGQARQGLPATVRLALMDAAGTIIGTPYIAFVGRLDVPTIEDGGDTASVTIAYESRLADLQRPRIRRYTDEDQRTEYPTDRGLEYVAGLQDKQIPWGAD